LDKEYKDVIKQEFGSTAAAAKRVAENPEKKYAEMHKDLHKVPQNLLFYLKDYENPIQFMISKNYSIVE
jgi:hypothetical protein